MTDDPLFDAMRFFAYEDVHRAKGDKQCKTAWTQHLAERGREMAVDLGVEITDFALERKAIHVARYAWTNVGTAADIRRGERKAEHELKARARRKSAKPKQPNPKGSN